MQSNTGNSPRTEKELLAATRPFEEESLLTTWWYVGSTLIVLLISILLAALVPWWPLRTVFSILGGLTFVRAFILYHDFLHNAIARKSRALRMLLHLYGLFVLTPPRYWRYSHNFHHANVGKPNAPNGKDYYLVTDDIGTFPLMTTDMWKQATPIQRLRYRISRHPVTMLLAYVTVFFFSLCVVPLLTNPRKFWECGAAILIHIALISAIWVFAGFSVLFFAFLLPSVIAASMGAYLFFAQHNFPGMRIVPVGKWSHYRGALESSSYLRCGAIMRWFTGNIGYHHVHHLNSLIPFYRLPKAMAAIPELQSPTVTSFHPRDVLACLRLNLWDPDRERLVSYREAAAATPGPV